jgi:hypothetical protein
MMTPALFRRKLFHVNQSACVSCAVKGFDLPWCLTLKAMRQSSALYMYPLEMIMI